MIVVTGASGFIGRRLVPRLLAERPGVKLCCLVKEHDDAFGERGVVLLRSYSVEPIRSELVSGRGLSGLQSPQVVFHLAANTHTWDRDHRCNDLGTQNLLRAVSPLGPDSHFVFTSTVAVMDNRRDLREPLRPDTRTDGLPLSRYGRTKWRAEEFLRAEAKRLGFRLSIVRLCTVFGPEPRPNSLFNALQDEVLKRSLASRLNWPGLTSFIHVEDAVSCLLRIANAPPPPGETRTCLLATESRTLQEVARLVYCALKLPYRAVQLPTAAWDALGSTRRLCRWGMPGLPMQTYNHLWRFHLIVSPVLHCDTNLISEWFPDLIPRRMADCIGEVCPREELEAVGSAGRVKVRREVSGPRLQSEPLAVETLSSTERIANGRG